MVLHESYRDELDKMRSNQFVRKLYSARILHNKPILGQKSELRFFIIPLINSEVFEWHRLDRVQRQFGFCQCVSQSCNRGMELHRIDQCGRVVALGGPTRPLNYVVGSAATFTTLESTSLLLDVYPVV